MANGGVLIYSNGPFGRYRWISLMAAAQTIFIGLNFIILPPPRTKDKSNDESETKSEFELDTYDQVDKSSGLINKLRKSGILSPMNAWLNINERPLTSSIALGSSFLIIIGTYFYTRRQAHKIALLPGDRIQFSSFSLTGFGKPPTIELPAKDVSCVHGRGGDTTFSILKLRGYKGFHLVHKSDGEFHRPDLYDQFLGFERSWVNKKN